VLIDNSGSTAKDLKYEVGFGDPVRARAGARRESGRCGRALQLQLGDREAQRVHAQPGFHRPSLRALHGEAGHIALYDAILLASRDIEDRPGRKILVVVTDGGDTTSHTDFNRATEAAQLADAVIYPILVVPITNQAGPQCGR
jgi:Ca-activated chloride channel family protein